MNELEAILKAGEARDAAELHALDYYAQFQGAGDSPRERQHLEEKKRLRAALRKAYAVVDEVGITASENAAILAALKGDKAHG